MAPWHSRRLALSFPDFGERLDRYPLSFNYPDVRWEPGIGFSEELSELSLHPAGLTLQTAANQSVAMVAARFDSGLRPKNAEDRRYTAFIRYEHLRYLLEAKAPRSYIGVHLAPLRCIRRPPSAFGAHQVHSAPPTCIWRPPRAFGALPVHSALPRCIRRSHGAFGVPQVHSAPPPVHLAPETFNL